MMEDIYNQLRKDIQNKIGKKILYSSDCLALSKQIYKDTRRQISVPTIKRFFNIISSNFKPSRYTLETLILFLGFRNINDYLNFYDQAKYSYPIESTWDFLKDRIQLITKHSLGSIKQKVDYNAQKCILRAFAQKKFERFEASQKMATMFVAPEGYGKSTLLIQLIEKYFLDDFSKTENDIIALVDGGIFFNLYSRYSSIELLNQLLEFKISSSLAYFFRNNPTQCKGRVWLVIDSIDDIYYDQENYHRLVENVMRIIMANDSKWFKLILTCRPENLEIFSYLIEKNPMFRNYWFDVNFQEGNTAQVTNIPLLDQNEIEILLNKNEFKHDFGHLLAYQKEIINIICYPDILKLFIEEYKRNENISEILLLNLYISRRINSPPFQQGKKQLIDEFIKLTNLGKKSSSVNKKQLLSRAHYLSAYQQLITYGIIYEYNIHDSLHLDNIFVAFTQNTIFEYLLFEKWRNNHPLSPDLFFSIRDYYKNNEHLQCNLIKFLMQFLVLKKDLETIKKIYLKLENTNDVISKAEVPACLQTVSAVINQAMHNDTQFQKNMTPWLTRTKFGKNSSVKP